MPSFAGATDAIINNSQFTDVAGDQINYIGHTREIGAKYHCGG
jgi:hypothetical protein